MTLQVIDVIWYYICGNPTRAISSMKVSTTQNITHQLYVHDLSISFNMMAVSCAATVLASYWAPGPNIIILLRIHTPVKDRYWSNYPTSLSVLDDYCEGIQLARKLTYSLYYNGLLSLTAAQWLEHRYISKFRNEIVKGPSSSLKWSQKNPSLLCEWLSEDDVHADSARYNIYVLVYPERWT